MTQETHIALKEIIENKVPDGSAYALFTGLSPAPGEQNIKLCVVSNMTHEDLMTTMKWFVKYAGKPVSTSES